MVSWHYCLDTLVPDDQPETTPEVPELLRFAAGFCVGAADDRDLGLLGACSVSLLGGVTRWLGVIWNISRKMPGATNDSGFTNTSGFSIGPRIAKVMPKTPSPCGPVKSWPRPGIKPSAEFRPCSGT